MSKKSKNALAFPCDKCPTIKHCRGECEKVNEYMRKNKLPAEPRREHTITGSVHPRPPRSIEHLAYEMIEFEKNEEKEKEQDRIHILSAMYVKIQNIKDKRKKTGAIRKYFIYLCKLFNLSKKQTIKILRIHKATFFRNSI